jgi:hypothetical protein
MAIFWVLPLCRIVEAYKCFRGSYCLHHQGDDDGGIILTAARNSNPTNIFLNCVYFS